MAIDFTFGPEVEQARKSIADFMRDTVKVRYRELKENQDAGREDWSAAIKALRSACGSSNTDPATSEETPEGIVYCGGGGVKRQIEYVILQNAQDQWDAQITINGDTIRAITAYSYLGNSKPPKGFVVALLGEDRSEFLVFRDGDKDWLEFGDYTYRKCN